MQTKLGSFVEIMAGTGVTLAVSEVIYTLLAEPEHRPLALGLALVVSTGIKYILRR